MRVLRNSRDKQAWTLAIALWLVGAGLLAMAWYSPIFTGAPLDLVLYLVAFFYVFAIGPLYNFARTLIDPDWRAEWVRRRGWRRDH
jgi:cytochrome c oxidase assembly factor CtaG